MGDTIEIVKPTLADLDGLLALQEETFDLHLSLDSIYYVPWDDTVRDNLGRCFVAAISKDDPMLLAARDGDQLVGTILYRIAKEDPMDNHFKRCGVVMDIAVTEAARGKGIGKRLLNAVEEFFAEQDVSHIKLYCSTSNPRAHGFYEREGYVSRQQLFCKTLDLQTRVAATES